MTLRSLFTLFFCVLISFPTLGQYANIENDSLLVEGNKVYRSGDYEASAIIYKKSLDEHADDPNSKEWIIAAVGYGASLLDLGQIREGAKWIQNADDALTDEISYELQAYVKSHLGWATWWLGYAKRALPIYKEAHSLAVKSEDGYRVAQISNSLATLTQFLGSYSEAINYATIAHDFFKEKDDPFMLANAKVNLFNMYSLLGFTDRAETILKESLEIKLEMNNPDLIALDYRKLGGFYQNKGEYDKALLYFNKYLKIAFNDLAPLDIVIAKMKIGQVYLQMGEYETALEFLSQSQKERVENSFMKDAETASDMATIYQKLGAFDVSRSLFNQAIDLFLKFEEELLAAETYISMTDMELQAGNSDKAISLANKAIEIALNTESKLLRAKSFQALSKVYRSLNEHDLALSFAKKAYQSVSNFKGYRIASYLMDLSRAYYEIEPDSAYHYSDLAFNEIERVSKNIYGENLQTLVFSDYSSFYNEVAYWYLTDKNDAEKAFEVVEMGKSRVLLEQLSAKRNPSEVIDEPTLLQIRQREKVIDQLYRRLDEASDENEREVILEDIRYAQLDYDSFTNEVRLAHPSLKKYELPEVLSVEEITAMLDKSTSFIEYALFEDKIIAFWITKEGIESHITTIDSANSAAEFLHLKISDFRAGIESQKPREVLEELSKPLVQVLLSDFRSKYTAITNLTIVPSMSISVLPLEALLQNGKYLIEEVNVKYLPSLSIYPHIQNPHRDTEKQILAVASSGFTIGSTNNASSSQSNFSSLPASLMEVDSISVLFENKTILKNEQVTESGIKALNLEQYQYIHFATHGNINESNPLQSGLLISKKDDFEVLFGEDGYLNSMEISNLRLNADLVVLSACNTGMGKMVSGEGVLGMQRSFFQAGTSSVLVSLWNIFDKSTSTLMSRFYKKLKEHKEEEMGVWNKLKLFFDVYEAPLFGYKEKALRDAKLSLIDHPYYNHPIHWAPFVLYGK
jgi:CHAT domain-containing protein